MLTMRRRSALVLAVVGSLALTACTAGGAEPASSSTSADITIAYLQKQADQQYFVDEAEGARSKAQELGGVAVQVVNLELDGNRALAELDAAIARGVDGIAIVTPDQRVGPQIHDRARRAGIPLIASDDPIRDGDRESVPFVGFDGVDLGARVGQRMADLYREARWAQADTRILAVSSQDLSACADRVRGAQRAFADEVADVPQVIEVDNQNTIADAQARTAALLAAQPGVEHWLLWGCNDENIAGALAALRAADVAPADIIGIGIGGHLACKDWGANRDTGFRAALYVDGRDVGALAVQSLVNQIRSGVELPDRSIAKTTMLDRTNWQQTTLQCA